MTHDKQTGTGGGPLVSELAADRDMGELLETCVEEMPVKVRKLRELAAAGDHSLLARLARRIRGTGGGYGFRPISAAAGRLEDMLNARWTG